MKRKSKKSYSTKKIKRFKEDKLLVKGVLRKILSTLKKTILSMWKHRNIIVKLILLILIVTFCIFNVKYLLKLENQFNEVNNKVETITNELNTQTEEKQKLQEELNNTKTDLEQKIEEVKTSKAKQKEEEQKKAAEEQAKAEALRVASTTTSRSGTTSRTTATGTVAEYQAYAKQRCTEYGWTDTDFNNLVTLWNKESGWNPNSHNSSSGAHGIPQALPASKMASYGSDYLTNYKVQINWGLDYIKNRYSNPTNAMNHFRSKNWY